MTPLAWGLVVITGVGPCLAGTLHDGELMVAEWGGTPIAVQAGDLIEYTG